MTARKKKSFVISRQRWLRGTGDGLLRDAAGKSCCLGFIANQLGVPFKAMRGTGQPAELAREYHEPLLGFLIDAAHITPTALTQCAVDINDEEGLPGAERERALRKLFAEHGYTLRFVP